jgi:hypothetical protein
MIRDHRRPIRILFVLANLDEGDAQAQLRLLGDRLDPNEFRLDAVVCFRRENVASDDRCELEAPSIDVDCTPYDLGFEETVDYLSHKLPAYDILVSGPNVAALSPALDRLHWRPPLIEMPTVKDTPGLSRASFHAILTGRRAAPRPSVFASFMQGGFECSSHRRGDGKRLDLIAATGHDANVASDYRQLREHGIATVRDGLRWHLIEAGGEHDWSSFLPMLRAARQTRTQTIWDLMHYGWPDGLDIWSPAFVDHFARFAAAAARIVRSETDDIPFYCPINEISYLAWAGGDAACLNPFARGRSFELKAQLVRAAVAAMQEVLHIEPRARFVHCEPVIHIVSDPQHGNGRLEAERARQAQFQAFDMIAGTLWPQLGGEPRLLDITGVNYYRQNQWVLGGEPIDEQNRQHRPFRALLAETHARYGRPVLVAETGTEGAERAAWFEAIASEVAAARQAGIPVEGICLYPIIDHVGWDNDRECPSGLLARSFENGRRKVHHPLADAVARFLTEAGSWRSVAESAG